MASKYQAPRGTFDILPGDARERMAIEGLAGQLLGLAGYGRIATPAFEDTDLFVRGVGRSTDVVQKEMFTFSDKGDRSLTLRPEGTAPICRAYVEHGMHKDPQPVKLYYVGPFFRHERPQAGRYRQFHQVGAETIGSDSPLADAEAIVLLADLLTIMEVPGVELRLGSLGSLETRSAYLEDLTEYLRRNQAELGESVRDRIEANPLRAFDAKDEGTQAVMAEAPTLIGRLEEDDAKHFAEVRAALDLAAVEYRIDPTLVRGLDYYTRTIFSFSCDQLGAQAEIGGGGRYDGLIEQLGGPPTPAVGWAAGIDRIVLALREGSEGEPAEGPIASDTVVFIIAEGESDRALASFFATNLRRRGVPVQIDLAGRGGRGQHKHAVRLGAQEVLRIGDPGLPTWADFEGDGPGAAWFDEYIQHLNSKRADEGSEDE